MKVLKIALACLAVIAGLAGATFGIAYGLGGRKLERQVEIRVVPVPYTQDAEAIKLGKYLFDTRGCAECHGADGAGKVFIDDPDSGMFARSPNITRGAGSAVARYGEADWVRALRHGVSPSGHALLIMPSEDYNRLTDADFAALVAYVRSLPPVAGKPAEVRVGAIPRALYGLGLMRDASEKIDHKLPPPAPVPVAANAEHGAYVANVCFGCHGPKLSGGRIPDGPPDWPPAANLTPGEGSAMGPYDTAQKFAAMMRSGKRPDGTAVSRVMPFESFARMSDVDLDALYAYLKTVPARKAGGR